MPRRKPPQLKLEDPRATMASLLICRARCEEYADKARAKNQGALAEIYDNFELLLREYAEDVSIGLRGRVLIEM